ncbi:MAG: PKD domain-containing protein [Salinivirgaceae bacterium]|nr:PKD domain-containing protein [Salinivirgaceae bacterium]
MGKRIGVIFTLVALHIVAIAQTLPFPADNLQLWLRADSVELTDGKVSRWYDLSPNQYEIVQPNAAARPTVSANALNGFPAVLFNGSSDYLTGGDILDLGTDGWTWFVIGQYSNGNGQLNNAPTFISKYDRNVNWGAPMYMIGQYINELYWENGNNNGAQINPHSKSINSDIQFHIFSYEVRDNIENFAHDRAYLSNILIEDIKSQPINYSFNSTCAFKVGHTIISNSNAKGVFLNGQITEIIAFNTVDANLRNKVYNYLTEKYFPEFAETVVSLGLDIHVPYGFSDTAITTAYRPDFTSYHWSTGETDSIIHVNKSGKYWVTIANAFGYTSSDTINVFYPEPAQLLSDTTICASDTIVWNPALDGPYSYLWSNGSTGSSLEITSAGEYYVTITDTAGFSWNSDTILVEVDDYPLTTLFADEASGHTIDTALCSGNALGLMTNANATISYLWSTGASSSRIALTQPGDYTLVSTNARGCRATNTAHVTIKGKAPEIHFNVSGLCYGDETLFEGNATSAEGISSYLWVVDGTDSVPTKDFRYNFAAAGSHSVKVEVASGNACLNDSLFTVSIKEIPSPNFSFTPVCAGVPIDLINTSRIPDTCTVSEYRWSVNGITLGSDENLTYTFGTDASLTYSLTLDNGCAADTTINVGVKDNYTSPRYVSCVYPTNGQFITTDTVDFLWNPDDDIIYYELITSNNSSFAFADTLRCAVNNISLASDLFADTTYWKVKAYNHCMESMGSGTYMFRKTVDNNSDFSSNTSLQLWLRADSVGLADGRVSRWFDLSPNHYEIVQADTAAMPTISDDALNGQPAVTFNGTSNYLNGGDILDLETDSWTWFVVGQYYNGNNQLNNAPTFISKYDRNVNWGAPMYMLGQYMNELYWENGNNNGAQFNPHSKSINNDTEFHIFTCEMRDNIDDATHERTYLSNILIEDIKSQPINYSFNSTCSFKVGHTIISNSNANGIFLNGQIAEIIAFNTVDANLRNKVYNYLAERYYPEFAEPVVSLGLDIRIPYGFSDTAITTAYRPDFTSYLWSTGEIDSIIHVNKSGKYWVTVTNAFGYTSSDTINVFYPEPAQPFSDTTICAGDTITWDTNLDGPYSFLWSDGSTGRSVEITTAGGYWVEITDTLGFKWHSDTIMVEVDSFPVTARLEGDQIISCIGNNIYLQTGFEEAVSYLWSNGSTADHLEVTEAGQYWVKMTDKPGCKAADTAYISILGVAPTPDFTNSALCATREISFRDNSRASGSSQITSHLWQFGDGGTSTAINPEHSYALSGSYNLVLTIASDNGCSNQKRQKIVIDSLPKADFIPVRACSHTNVQFTDMSSTPVNYIVDWQWTMNDTVFAERHPSTVFASQGDMPVQLIVTTAHGCTDTLRRTINIMQGPDVGFTFSAPCVNTPIYFTNSTSSILGLSTSYTWTADETVFSQQRSPMIEYADTGTHIISLSVKQLANGCSATVSKTVSVKANPRPDVDADSFCAGKAASLRGVNRELHSPSGEWLWSLDTLPEMQGQTISPVFAKSGRHKARLTIVDGNGCTAIYDTVINVRATPTAAFSARSARGPIPFEAEFVNTSRNASNYLWDFGDGRTSTETDACHTYNIDGEYTVSLEVSNGNCADTAVRIVSAIVPQMNLRLLSATAETVNGVISIEAVIANLSNFDITDIGIAWRDNLGHLVSEASADTIRQNKVLRYRFKAAIGELNPERIQYICVEVQPGAAFADDYPDDNEYCIILNNSEFTACLPKPNPADKELNISYIMPEDGNVRVELFNSRGIVAAVLYDGPASAGFNSLNVDVQRFKPGMYVYKITYGETSKTQPVLISR